jgi:hypothetical protein
MTGYAFLLAELCILDTNGIDIGVFGFTGFSVDGFDLFLKLEISLVVLSESRINVAGDAVSVSSKASSRILLIAFFVFVDVINGFLPRFRSFDRRWEGDLIGDIRDGERISCLQFVQAECLLNFCCVLGGGWSEGDIFATVSVDTLF